MCHKCRNKDKVKHKEGMFVECDSCETIFCLRSLVRTFEIDLIEFLRERQEPRRWECPRCTGTCNCVTCNFPLQPTGKYEIYRALIPKGMKMGLIDVSGPLGPKRLASQRGSDSPQSDKKRQRQEEMSYGVSSHELLDSYQRRLPRMAKATNTSYDLSSAVTEEGDSLSPFPDSFEDDYESSDSGNDVNLSNERVSRTRSSGAEEFNDKIPPINERAIMSSLPRDIQYNDNPNNGYIYSDSSDDENAPGRSPSGPALQTKNDHFRSPTLGQPRQSRRAEPDNNPRLSSSSATRVTPTNAQSGQRQSTCPEHISVGLSRSTSRQAPTALYTPPQESQPENNKMSPASATSYSTMKIQLQNLREIAERTREMIGWGDIYQKAADKVTEKQKEITKMETDFEALLNCVRNTGDVELEAEFRNRGRQDGYWC